MTGRECIRFVVDWRNDNWFQRTSEGAHKYGADHPRSKIRSPYFTPRKCPQMPRKMPRNADSLFNPGLGPYCPLRLKAIINLVPRSHHFPWYPADSVCSGTDVVQLLRGHRASVAANAAGIRTVIAVFEPRRRSKIKRGKCARLSQRMSGLKKSAIALTFRLSAAKIEYTYGLGMTLRSSKDDVSGRWAGSIGEYGRIPPLGLSGLPA